MAAFQNIVLQPSYGARRTLITWRVDLELKDASFYIFRSPDGAGDWQLLNEYEPAEGIYTFEDIDFFSENLHDVPHYRILAKRPNLPDVHSPTVGLFDEITRTQMGGVSKMMRQEYLRMVTGNGVRILHYIPKTMGELADNVDGDTGQVVGGSCPKVDPSQDSFGLKYKGGYRKPLVTLCEFMKVGGIALMDHKEGLGMVDEFSTQARFLAYPRPKMGDLIVQPKTDERYLVGDTIEGYFFRGIIPIAFDIKLQKLARSHAAYRVPVPFPLPPLTSTPPRL